MAERMPIGLFVSELKAALDRKDGYIMCALGQNPKKLNSWYFDQYKESPYTKKQYQQAIYWRDHAARVWDCNGLSEGLYKDYTGVDINTKARYNYANWCDPKGKGMIPVEYRVPGAAIFWSDSGASSIHHVAYLYEPVDKNNPGGDWYIIEARGVMYGVVKTKLFARKPTHWGLMTRYFNYDDASRAIHATDYHLGDRVLKNGCDGADVKEMQNNLIILGYDCGKYGADGDFGDSTEIAVKAFQKDNKLSVDGEFGPKSLAAMMQLLTTEFRTVVENPKIVRIVGGQCYVRSEPSTAGKVYGVAKENSEFEYKGQMSEGGWLKITYEDGEAWVSGKYGKLIS